MATNNYKATLTLALVTVGFAAGYPFADSFAGGLATSGCAAAMVGGIADWFAVTALFRRPLGIPFRTEIIPRNRQRITQAIVEMVEEELLTTQNIRKTLQHYDLESLLVRYLADYGGKEHLEVFVNRIGDEALAELKPAEIGRFLAELVLTNANRMLLAPPLAQTLTWSVNHGYFDKWVDFVIGELMLLAEHPRFRALLAELIAEARQGYEKDLFRRKLAGQFLEGLGLTDDGLAGLAQARLEEFLAGLVDLQHPLRQGLRREATGFAARLANDPDLQSRCEQWKSEALASLPDLEKLMSELADAVLGAATGETGKAGVHRWLGLQVDKLIAGFKATPRQQQILAMLIRRNLMTLIGTHHARIGTIVRERVNQFSTPALVEFIEGRVGNDLQMIRINGSVVGGLAGIVIFLLTRWWPT